MAKEIRLNTIEYTTKDGTSWRANVLSEGIQESIDLLRVLVGKDFDRMHSTDSGNRVDQVTQYVKDLMTVEVIKEVEKPHKCKCKKDVDGFVCPWCDKSFKNLKNLKSHIIKFHIDE